MGILTESTYAAHGRHWSETLFYTHFFSFLFSLTLTPTLLTQYRQLMSHPSDHHSSTTKPTTSPFPLPVLPHSLQKYTPPLSLSHPATLLALNALTQIACISGVNRLSASTTAVTVTVVLNIRKLVSFLLSCVIFGNHVSGLMGVGAGLVFVAGAVYGWDSSRSGKKGKEVGKVDEKIDDKAKEKVKDGNVGGTELGSGNEEVVLGGGGGGGRRAVDNDNGGTITRRVV